MTLEGLVIAIVVLVTLFWLVRTYLPDPFRTICVVLLALVVTVLVIKLVFALLGPPRLGRIGLDPDHRGAFSASATELPWHSSGAQSPWVITAHARQMAPRH